MDIPKGAPKKGPREAGSPLVIAREQFNCVLVLQLKFIANCELYFTRRACRPGDLPERGRCNVSVRQAEAMVIEYIKEFSTELQPMAFRPRHFEILQDGHICVPETWTAKNISVADRSVARVTEVSKHLRGIGEVLDRSARSIVDLPL